MRLDRHYLESHAKGDKAMNPEGTGLWAATMLRQLAALEAELVYARRELDYLLHEAPPGRLSGDALSSARARVQRLEEVLHGVSGLG